MKLIPEIVINVSPETFHFIFEDHQLILDTCVHLKYDENGYYQFVSVGDKSIIPDSVFVPLFENHPLDPSIERFDLLTRFMEYGIEQMFANIRRPVLKPRIVIKGADHFQEYFSGYHKFFLEAMALAGGAREVKFE
jgi:hypothetical protein